MGVDNQLQLFNFLLASQFDTVYFGLAVSFNNMQTLKFKAQPTNMFFTTVSQMFGSSSQLPNTSKQCFVVCTVHNNLITTCSAVVGSWEQLPDIWLMVAKNAFVGWALSFRVRMLLKGAVILYLVLIACFLSNLWSHYRKSKLCCFYCRDSWSCTTWMQLCKFTKGLLGSGTLKYCLHKNHRFLNSSHTSVRENWIGQEK